MATSLLGKRNRAHSATAGPCAFASAKRLKQDAEFQILDDSSSQEGAIVSSIDLPVEASIPESNENTPLSKQILKTPKTPRHRDALANTQPVTPTHRSSIISQARLARTPTTPRTTQNVYSDARRLFSRGSQNGPIVGRQDELAELHSFLKPRLEGRKGGCLYVSGPPGTGKSASVGQICKELSSEIAHVAYSTINCMSVKHATDIYTLLRGELFPDDNVFVSGGEEALEKHFTSKDAPQKIYLVLLDEIDQLLTLDTAVLYNLFEWSMHKHSSLLVVGISNALDLTDRFLPKLKARNLKPQLLPFLPYSAAQIAAVLTARVRSLLPPNTTADAKFTPFLMPPAIQLISKKVASQNGDLRKAFDLAQRVIDLVDTEARDKLLVQQSQQTPQSSPTKTPLAENPNLSSPPSTLSPTKLASPTKPATPSAPLQPETAPRASIAHVLRVTAQTFTNSAHARLAGLTLQQKAVLCTLAALDVARRADLAATPSSGRGPRAPTMRALYDAYALLCRRENLLSALAASEFRDVVGNLEALGLVCPADGKTGPGAGVGSGTPSRKGRGAFSGLVRAEDRRIGVVVAADELRKALDGPGTDVLRTLLDEQL